MKRSWLRTIVGSILGLLLVAVPFVTFAQEDADRPEHEHDGDGLTRGRLIFRFDTFGDEDFWGGTLQLHRAIEGSRFGGVGTGIRARTAPSLGLKVDVDALPPALQEQLKYGKINLDDPAVSLALLKLNAVIGVT